MKVNYELVKLSDVLLNDSGLKMLDVHETISQNLSKEEQAKYLQAINKVNNGKKLNRKDVKLLDQIDALTMQMHGICLKDSLVTKARLKAAKSYGIEFNDRDGLIDHMNMMLGVDDEHDAAEDVIGNCLLQNLCPDCMEKVNRVMVKIANRIPLDQDDVWIMQEASSLIFEELGFSFDDSEIGEALLQACEELGVEYVRHEGLEAISSGRQLH